MPVITEVLEQRQLLTPTIASLDRLPTAAGEFDFQISGTAEAGSQVSVRQAGVGVVGQTHAMGSGTWTINVDGLALANGRFEFSATEGDPAAGSTSWSDSKVFQPNILLVNVDDMRADDLPYMPFVSSVLASQGTVFTNMFTPTALCGPSRATLMTGLFAERSGISGNSGPLGGSVNLDLSSSLPVWLDNAGYRTGLFGKDRTTPWIDQTIPSQKNVRVSPGWDEYFSFTTGQAYSGFVYKADHNGTLQSYSNRNVDYATDVLHRKVTEFIDSSLAADSPFFAYMAPVAPHYPFTPAPRHFGTLNDSAVFHSPSFNLSESGSQPFDDAKIVSMDNDRRRARESLLAVDESIQTQYSQLSDAGALDNTVIVFTSDNGYLFGEHGVIRKNMFYDEAMRVPLIVWDGRQATQSTSDALVLNADIGPTIAWMTGAATPADLDGKNLVPLMTSPTASVRDDFLIYHRYADPSWSHDEVGVRNKNWVYATRSDGTTFLFDMENDPYQLLNLAANSEYAVVRDTLAARLEELRPSDRVAPIATQVSVALAPEAANGSRAIRITANVTDLEHGNSEIRTPELIFSLATSPGYGIPLDAVDGRFDSETEDTFLDLTVNQYFAAGSPETVYLRFRDVPGNWSDPYPVSLSLNSSLHLNAESDTGDSSSDGVTVDNQPKFSGSGSAPGATITLFAARLSPTVSAAIVVGTVTADSNGDWEVTSLPFASAGVYLINGVERSLDEQGQPRTVLFRPFSLHLLAVRGPLGSVFITGTTSDDQIRVSASFGESLNFWLNDVWAGALPAGTALNIQGAAGDDRLEVNGNLPASLFGGPGNDTLIGGTGIDVLSGGAGSNQLLGGPGDDTYLFDDIGVVDLMAVSLTDLVDEHSNEGFDSFSFVTPFGIVADLNPDSADPSVVMKSPYRVQRTIKFETPGFVRNVERLDGSIVRDSIRVGPQNFVQGRGGNDQISVMPPMVPGQTLALRQLTSGLAFASSTSISASIQASKGTLSLNKVLPTEISFSQLTDQRIQLQGPLVSVNSFLNSDGLKFTAPETFTGRITLTLRSFPESAPATSESDIATFAVTYQPSIVTGGAVQWTEGGHPVFLAPVGTASDQDANFTGAVLKASGLTFFDSSDRLMIIPETPAPGAVTLDGSLVLFGGVPVGTWTFFSSSQELLVTFNQSATNAALQAIVRRIGFENSSQDPIGGNRTIRFQVVDGAGLGSTVSTTTVLVKPTRVIIQNQVLTLREDANTSSAVMLGSILVKDDPLETSVFSLSGTDADSFQMTERVLSLKPDTLLNASTKASYQVSVTANDATTGDIIGVSADYVLSITSTVPVITSPLTSRTLLPTFKWNAVPGAVSYDIWIRNATTQQDSYRTASTSNLFYTPAANLEIGRFDARVRSVNVNGRKSDWSDPVQITINTAVKLKPLALLQTTRPMISWLVLPGAVSYDVWVDTVPAATSPFLLQSGLTKTLFRPSGDLSMGTYRVLVRGIDAEGISAAWSVASPFTIAPAPSLLSPLTATFDRTPEFEWTAVNGALNYEIVVTSILTGQTVIQTTVTTNQFASAAVLPAGFYAWKVRANGPQSIVGRFSTIVQIHIGGRPKILGPVGQSPSVPVFLWTPVQWAATYELRVDRTDVEMIGVINLSNLNTNTYVPGASLIAGTYRFWVRAVSTSGSRSIWSIAATFQIASAEAGLSRPLALYLQPLPVALNRQVMALSDFQTTLSPTPAISFVDSAATAETGKLAVDFETKWSDDMPALITDEYFSMICDRLAPAADYF